MAKTQANNNSAPKKKLVKKSNPPKTKTQAAKVSAFKSSVSPESKPQVSTAKKTDPKLIKDVSLPVEKEQPKKPSLPAKRKTQPKVVKKSTAKKVVKTPPAKKEVIKTETPKTEPKRLAIPEIRKEITARKPSGNIVAVENKEKAQEPDTKNAEPVLEKKMDETPKPEVEPTLSPVAEPEIKQEVEPEIKDEQEPPENEPAPETLKELSPEDLSKTLLMECAWEVCNQVGGIYTVIQTKVPATKIKWKDNYLLLGPYFEDQAAAIFEHDPDLYKDSLSENGEPEIDPVKEIVKMMNTMGFSVHYGTWLIDGRPKAVLFDPVNLLPRIHENKYIFWEHHNISLPGSDSLVDKVVSFGFQVYEFIRLLSQSEHNHHRLLAHFHEWMAGIPIPELRRNNIDTKIVFTTHATMLGRYLAMNDPKFYDHLPFYDWKKEAEVFNIRHIVEVERAASHGAHIFSTVSDITANECKYLLGRQPECILPNGLNITRFEAMHEFQVIHKKNKGKINEFVMGHFFHNYTFDLNKTLYFFTSGRFEYYNKGFDITLEALARLNWKMKEQNIDTTVVMFFITRNPYHSINPGVLESRAKLEEIRRNCDDIQEVLAEKLFDEMLVRDDANAMPNLNKLIDDYLALRLRRNIGSWRNKQMPAIVTHDLVDEHKDPIMNFLKTSNLLNFKEDKVKVVYHPDFVSTADSLFRMEYLQFVRGCHLGVFPSYYEPWGYTPLECCASGLPSVTTDLSGFGSYVTKHVDDYDNKGLSVIKRRDRPIDEVVEELSNMMLEFVKLDRRNRIALRNRIEESSAMFGWRHLRKFYDDAYARVFGA